MRPTSAIQLFLLLLILSSCSSTTMPEELTTSTTGPIDLTDPATQSALGSPLQTDINWQRNVDGITVLGQTSSADPTELALLNAALTELPAELRTLAKVRSFVRVHDVPDAEDITSAVTVSVGPDVFLLDRTFSTDSGLTSRLDLTYALAHELTHIAQWFTLDDSYVRSATSGEIERVQLGAGSTLVRDFAETTGWINNSADPLAPDWQLDNGIAPSEYALSSPVEDLAETVALTAIGRDNWLDEARRSWMSDWLGIPVDTLSMGKAWLPVGSLRVHPTVPLFDEPAVADLAAALGKEHIEAATFVVTGLSLSELAQLVQKHLADRGLTGTLGSIESAGAIRFHGGFSGLERSELFVDVRTVPRPEGQEDVVLTYVAIW